MTNSRHPSRNGCEQYAWCMERESGHTEHRSQGVPVPDAADAVLYMETHPETSTVVYGPVIGGESADRSVGEARVLAAEFRVTAARLDALVAWAEAS